MTSAKELRNRLRTQRRAIPLGRRAELTERICSNIVGSKLFRTSRRVALYWATHSEVDVSAVWRRAWALHKRVYLPVLLGPFHNHLRFAAFDARQRLRKNCYGIPEPPVAPAQLVAGIGLDLVLVPLVGFDARGTRLGMGGGYYDRSFALRRTRRHWRKPFLLGVAFEMQRVETLMRQPWDVALDGVVTEDGVFLFDSASR
jgi:5-formyltetrahydrofolate cyclo-ligase